MRFPHGSSDRSTPVIRWRSPTRSGARSRRRHRAQQGIYIASGGRAGGAKFSLGAMSELRNRGTEDIPLAVADGLKGCLDAIAAVLPEAIVETCVVHVLRNSIGLVSWKGRQAWVSALKTFTTLPMPTLPRKR